MGDNPNNPNAVGPVRGTQINRPQTQFHSVVRQGNAAAEPTLVAKDVSKIQNLHLGPKKVSWRPGRAGKRGRSERVARARAAFDKASGVDTEALQGSHKGCGPLCQLRLFVQDNRK